MKVCIHAPTDNNNYGLYYIITPTCNNNNVYRLLTNTYYKYINCEYIVLYYNYL